MYWRDSGLLHALLGVPDDDMLLAQPRVGASWEGFVIEQILSVLEAEERACEPSFFRTSDGHELDLILDVGREQWAIEVKLTASPSPEDMARLNQTADLVGAARRFLVTRTPRPAGSDRQASCDLPWLLARLPALG